jgi:hypothetical protein
LESDEGPDARPFHEQIPGASLVEKFSATLHDEAIPEAMTLPASNVTFSDHPTVKPAPAEIEFDA